MGLDKLGNPQLQNQGSEARSAVHDQRSHQFLEMISIELQAIRLILSEMGDLEINNEDLGVAHDR